jgi:hypothetical protein
MLRIAVLDADTPVPAALKERGLYSDIFAALLHKAAETLPYVNPTSLSFSKYHVVNDEWPTDVELVDIDGLIITGSCMLCLNAFVQVRLI